MPIFPFPWSTRPGARDCDALLAGTSQPGEAPEELRAVAELFAALRAPSDQREVADWDHALIAFRGIAGPREAPARSRWRQRIAAPLSTKLAAVAGVAVVTVLGGGVAAAYTGNLPVTLQKVAHDTIAAPGVRETRAVTTPGGPVHPAGSPATGTAAYGLCRAYQQAEKHGNAGQKSVAFRHLVTAAGGAGQVMAYCAAVQPPVAAGPSAGPSASQPGRRVGQSGSPGHSNHHPRKKPTVTPTPTPPGKSKKDHGGGNGNQSP
ncbi:MAG TPA: hypothetical protein VIX15_09745 [Streptosporangiaceae bacterium]